MTGYRRPVSDADRAAAAEARQATLDKLHAQLSDGVLALNDPQAWQAWLTFASRFHKYSFGNSLLIMAQDPQATHVAGYQAFKAMGRQVRRGETGIKVLAPITRREPRLDDTGRPQRDESGRPLYRTHVVATKPVTVFDIRQTNGPPLPDPGIGQPTLLTGQAPVGLWDRLQGFLEERGFEVRRGPCHDGANGYTDFTRRLVVVRDDVDDAQSVKTLAHEGAHSILHADRSGLDCRGILEVEAESVAYMVTNAHGLDSSQYTFNYVAGWALNAVTEDRHLADILRSTGQRVIGAADLILQATQPAPSATDAARDALETDLRIQTDPTRWEAVSVGNANPPRNRRPLARPWQSSQWPADHEERDDSACCDVPLQRSAIASPVPEDAQRPGRAAMSNQRLGSDQWVAAEYAEGQPWTRDPLGSRVQDYSPRIPHDKVAQWLRPIKRPCQGVIIG